MGALAWLMNMGFAASGAAAPVIPVYARYGTTPQLMPKWDDKTSIHSWQSYHDIRHRTLRKAASLAGVTIMQNSFGGTLDTSWFRRHLMAHLALEHIQPIGHAMSSNALGIKGWDTEQDFYHWHLVHSLIHARLDQLYGTVV